MAHNGTFAVCHCFFAYISLLSDRITQFSVFKSVPLILAIYRYLMTNGTFGTFFSQSDKKNHFLLTICTNKENNKSRILYNINKYSFF